MTDWDAEMKKIDKQLESMSDKALIPASPPARVDPRPGAAGTVHPGVSATRENTRTWGAFLRLALATALGVAILFWPYPRVCGLPLAAYVAAVTAVVAGGLWSSIWTWKHRTSRAHVLSLLLVIWGLLLGGIEVLPRVGYARPDSMRPPGFACLAAPTVPSLAR